jgi:hypothetical protein
MRWSTVETNALHTDCMHSDSESSPLPGSRNRPELLPGLRQRLSQRPDGKADRSGGALRLQFSRIERSRSPKPRRSPTIPPVSDSPSSSSSSSSSSPFEPDEDSAAGSLALRCFALFRLEGICGRFKNRWCCPSLVSRPRAQLPPGGVTARRASARCIPSPLSAISMTPSGSIALDQSCSRGATCNLHSRTLGIARLFTRSCAAPRPFPLCPHAALFPSCSGHLGHLAKTLWTF